MSVWHDLGVGADYVGRPDCPLWLDVHVTKDGRSADCELCTHQLGWELRLATDQALLQSSVCAAQDGVLDVGEVWKAAMLGKGWRWAL